MAEDLTIERCVFTGNSSNWGGGVAVARERDDSQALKITNFTFMEGLSITTHFWTLRLAFNAFHDNRALEIGGGLHLLANRYDLEGNWITENRAVRNGGGVACGARSMARFTRNRVLRNQVTRRDPSESPGGGAGIYGTFWTGDESRTELVLADNKIIGNVSSEDGGGLRATCGTSVRLEPGNLFQGNTARYNGGGISLNCATLEVLEGNQFIGNKALGDGPPPTVLDTDLGLSTTRTLAIGYGGAIHCAAGLASLVGPALYSSCTRDGAALILTGKPGAPIVMTGNTARAHGSAINVFQEVGPTVGIPFLMTLVGVLNRLNLAHLVLDQNPGDPPSTMCSSLAFWDVNTSIDESPTGSRYDLTDVIVRLTHGVGILFVRSDRITRDASVDAVCLNGGPDCTRILVQP